MFYFATSALAVVETLEQVQLHLPMDLLVVMFFKCVGTSGVFTHTLLSCLRYAGTGSS